MSTISKLRGIGGNAVSNGSSIFDGAKLESLINDKFKVIEELVSGRTRDIQSLLLKQVELVIKNQVTILEKLENIEKGLKENKTVLVQSGNINKGTDVSVRSGKESLDKKGFSISESAIKLAVNSKPLIEAILKDSEAMGHIKNKKDTEFFNRSKAILKTFDKPDSVLSKRNSNVFLGKLYQELIEYLESNPIQVSKEAKGDIKRSVWPYSERRKRYSEQLKISGDTIDETVRMLDSSDLSDKGLRFDQETTDLLIKEHFGKDLSVFNVTLVNNFIAFLETAVKLKTGDNLDKLSW